MARQVKLTMRAVAFGTLAEQVARLALGRPVRFSGFLMNARTSKSLVFHIQAIAIDPVVEPISEQELNTI